MISRVIFNNMVVVWIVLIIEFRPVSIVTFWNFLKKILSSRIFFSFSFLLWAQFCSYSDVKTPSNQIIFLLYIFFQFPALRQETITLSLIGCTSTSYLTLETEVQRENQFSATFFKVGMPCFIYIYLQL